MDSGDATHSASSGTTHLTVTRDATATTVAIEPSGVPVGGSVTLSARVTSALTALLVALRTFTAAGTTLCTAILSGGAGSCAAVFPSAGSYQVTGKVSRHGDVCPSSGTGTLGVTQNPDHDHRLGGPAASINAWASPR